MEPHFYSFYKTLSGNLRFKGIFLMKYYNSEIENGLVVFKDNEIETAKDNFLVGVNKVLKTGKGWLNNELSKKLIKKIVL